MDLKHACIRILNQLADLVSQTKESDFGKPVATLSNATIGQHLRHTLEFFTCLENGFNEGIINYDKREHDKLIETDKFLAISVIASINDFITRVIEDRPLLLEAGYDLKNDDCITISTSYTRELIYNIEHAVHHMALIKIGVKEVAPYVNLSPEFGIAASTIRYKESIQSKE